MAAARKTFAKLPPLQREVLRAVADCAAMSELAQVWRRRGETTTPLRVVAALDRRGLAYSNFGNPYLTDTGKAVVQAMEDEKTQ